MANVSESVLTRDDASVIGKTVIAEAIGGFFYGIEGLFFIVAVYNLFCRGLQSSIARSVLLATTAVIFLCSTTTIVCNIMQDVVQITGLGDPEYNYMPAMQKAKAISTVSTRISYLLGDVTVVWRAWVFFGNQPYCRSFLAVCLLTSFVGVIVNLVFSLKSQLDAGLSQPFGTQFILPLTVFITNIVATSLIIYRTWHYRHFIKQNLSSSLDRKRTQIENILILLLVSEALYTSLWIVDLISLTNPQLYDLALFLGSILPHAVGVYPTAIVVFTAHLMFLICDSLHGILESLMSPFSSNNKWNLKTLNIDASIL